VTAERQSTADSVRTEIERTLQRSLKGLEYLSSSGPPLGVTPRDLIQRRGTMALYHYRPLVNDVYRVPMLLVMALTNRGYILDLAPGQSFVEFLLKRGHDVYMIDWNPPRRSSSFRIAYATSSDSAVSRMSTWSAIAWADC